MHKYIVPWNLRYTITSQGRRPPLNARIAPLDKSDPTYRGVLEDELSDYALIEFDTSVDWDLPIPEDHKEVTILNALTNEKFTIVIPASATPAERTAAESA